MPATKWRQRADFHHRRDGGKGGFNSIFQTPLSIPPFAIKDLLALTTQIGPCILGGVALIS